MEQARVAVHPHRSPAVPALAMLVPERCQHAVGKPRQAPDRGLERPPTDAQLHKRVRPVGGDQGLHLSQARLDRLLLDGQGLQTRPLVCAGRLEAALTLGDGRRCARL